ncbi:AraC family transcriptional regulator [Serratia sp. DD3]|uniref:helix-turn-helix domain-containing protein n=1 Tax=Serratia sp. DD3 TaxID=1410619 RepID=UPI00135F1C12|nr:helix-turn-helix domain-containing protein [Serratia sp. DD3]
MRFGYQMAWVGKLQPIGAVLIPLLCYFAYMQCVIGSLGKIASHTFVLSVLVLFAQHVIPVILDWIIIVSYLGYGFAVLRSFRLYNKNNQLVTTKESGTSHPLWFGAAILLIMSGVIESLIVMDFALMSGVHVGKLITFGNVTIFILVVLMSPISWRQSSTEAGHEMQLSSASPHDVALYENWFNQINQRLLHEHLYLDADLNLALLARKVGLPARKISQAINQQTGMNVSQFINKMRIQYAAQRLVHSESTVTEVMLDAGFNTKSNFNREFRRVYGVNPSEWRQNHSSTSC